MMERFNEDARVFCFILSTRSGGLGLNLTGADTVIFYDSDWNPAMDAQAQDRAHRIGQTKQVHIYRLLSVNTVEENIFKKALQKRQLENITLKAAEQGFDPAASLRAAAGAKVDLRELLGVEKDGGPELALEDSAWAGATRAAEEGVDAAAAECAAAEENEAAEEFAPDQALDKRIAASLNPIQKMGFQVVQQMMNGGQ